MKGGLAVHSSSSLRLPITSLPLLAALLVAWPGLAHAAAPAAKPSLPRVAVLRLQEDLARLGYLPVGWDGHAFTFPQRATPQSLVTLFRPGVTTPLVQGALMSFEADHALPLSSSPTAADWTALRRALAAGDRALHPFTYAYVSKRLPERIYIWSTAGVLTQAPVNTGLPGAATPDGSYPVYLRLSFQVMKGTNLAGGYYADPVHWISYFHGGDAVHGFVRPTYGHPQSLGCVEVPSVVAERIFDDLQIGSVVTVSDVPFDLTSPPVLLSLH